MTRHDVLSRLQAVAEPAPTGEPEDDLMPTTSLRRSVTTLLIAITFGFGAPGIAHAAGPRPPAAPPRVGPGPGLAALVDETARAREWRR
jgi:hypothetical protein